MALKFATVGEADVQKIWEALPVGATGLTLNVLEPVLPEPVTINVWLRPAAEGVTLTPVSWPDEKDAEVPVIPAVPL